MYHDLQEFIADLEVTGDLVRVKTPVDPVLEVTEICDRSLRADGPALLFEAPKGCSIPMVGNLFGSARRMVRALGRRGPEDLRELGSVFALLKEPRFPGEVRGSLQQLSDFRRYLYAMPNLLESAPCRDRVIEAPDVDLALLPVQQCWPDDAGRTITFGMVITKGSHRQVSSIGVYRQTVVGRNKLLMNWPTYLSGAIDFQEFRQTHPRRPFPVAVVIGADPATLAAAVAPLPGDTTAYEFAGLLRGGRSDVIPDSTGTLWIPASAEIVLEGHIYPDETVVEGNGEDRAHAYGVAPPILTVERITHRQAPLYHASYSGRAPYDEAAVLTSAFNEVLIPFLQRQFPEIVDFYLPPHAAPYHLACVSIKKRYPGHARRVMFGVWSSLRQFTATRLVIVTDDDIDVRNWGDVIWALSARMHPGRDAIIVDNAARDETGRLNPGSLGDKIGFDATIKWAGETTRPIGRAAQMSATVKEHVDTLWGSLGIPC